MLGVLPTLGANMRRKDIVKHFREKPNSPLAEAVRNLRTSILFSNIDRPPKVVMLTSSVPEEGKSTSALLLAMTSRQMGKSTIIVDCDLRRPALGHLMDAAGDHAELISVLEGEADVNAAMFEDPDTGLNVLMTRGARRSGNINAADVLSSRKFEQLIKSLSERYDLVILDTPPTLVVTDARVVAQLADTVVYAVRWDKTPRGAVLEGLKDMRAVEAPIAGVLMTMVNEKKASRHAYDGYSYYKGHYKQYYET